MSEDALTWLRQQRAVAHQNPVQRGHKPRDDSNDPSGMGMAIGYGLIAVIVSYLVIKCVPPLATLPFHLPTSEPLMLACLIGAIVASGYLLLPIPVYLLHIVSLRRLPNERVFKRFNDSQRVISFLVLTFGLTYGFNHAYSPLKMRFIGDIEPMLTSAMEQAPNKHFNHRKIDGGSENQSLSLPLDTWEKFTGSWLVAIFLTDWGFRQWRRRKSRAQNISNKKKSSINPAADHPFHLWLGTSTGVLAKRSHRAAIAPDHAVALTLEEACQNILVLGAIGSGKTTRAMHPLLLQLLDQEAGGLIFDIKGDFHQAVMQFAHTTQRNIVTIGVHHQSLNLLAGLTPEVAASFLKSVFLLNNSHRGESFWVDTATELCRNTLGLLSCIPDHYSLQGLYHYLFDTKVRLVLDERIDEVSHHLGDREQRLLATYQRYYAHIFDTFDERVKASVLATVAQVLAPFDHPDLVDTFCSTKEKDVPIEALLEGQIYLVELPLAKWGLGAKVVYTLLKLRFFNVMQSRALYPEWNQSRPVFFMCDEYQEIVSSSKDGLSDLNFWDKSRSSKTIGIISAQAISSFYAAIGDRDVTHALLQNFRQKLCFRTEDTTTLHYFDQLIDKVEVKKITHSHTSGKSKSGFLNHNTTNNSSTTTNVSYHDKSVLDAQVFRGLEPYQAVVLLSIQGRSLDDILSMMAIYL